ncbi:hypothetical protein SAMN05518855_1009130 [Paenibacillus sp. CF384]|nr:hypothetical protein SAMN05518855_1009130 [Paenibacillus sp. CF384]
MAEPINHTLILTSLFVKLMLCVHGGFLVF